MKSSKPIGFRIGSSNSIEQPHFAYWVQKSDEDDRVLHVVACVEALVSQYEKHSRHRETPRRPSRSEKVRCSAAIEDTLRVSLRLANCDVCNSTARRGALMVIGTSARSDADRKFCAGGMATDLVVYNCVLPQPICYKNSSMRCFCSSLQTGYPDPQ